MKAIRIHTHGGLEVLRIDEIPEPRVAAKQVKVRMAATALNHMDLWVRNGLPGISIPLPIILGCEGSGVVTDVGTGCAHVKIGDRVLIQPGLSCGGCASCLAGDDHYCRQYQILGEHTQGCHAESVVLPEQNVVVLPETVELVSAAGFPLVFLTAWQMIVKRLVLQAGETVLIVASASGVGSAAIQIAKLMGARVIATAGSDEKVKKALELGADFAINHHTEKISEAVRRITGGAGVEAVFEHVGAAVWSECLKSMARQGRLVTCGATSGPKVEIDLRHVFIKNLRILGSTMGSKGDLHAMLPFLKEGRLRPVVDHIYPYQAVCDAQARLEASHNFGKVILRWDHEGENKI